MRQLRLRRHGQLAGRLERRRLEQQRRINTNAFALPVAFAVAFALSFLLAAGDFVVPTMVGGTQGVMVGNLVNGWVKGVAPTWPLGAVLVFVLLALIVLILAGTTRLVRVVTRL